jgi:hypothetical protein
VLKDVREYRNKHGHPPTMVDYFSYREQLELQSIKTGAAEIVFDEILAQQKPIISRSELLELFISKRHSLRDYIVKYNVHIESWQNTVEVMTCEYAFKNNKLLFDVIRQSEKDLHSRFAYDNEKVITLYEKTNVPKQAGIQKENGLGLFLQPQMPLFVSGFFDSKVFGFPYNNTDVVSFLTGPFITLPDGTKTNLVPFVFEKLEIIDNRKCIVVSDFNVSMFFDIERDFSLIQRDGYHQVMTTSSSGETMLSSRELVARTRLYDLTDYGNGIWLPSKIEIERFSKPRIPHALQDKVIFSAKHEIVNVSSIQINQGIKDDFFTDFIPNDAFVSDLDNKLVYKQGDKASINSLLKETAKSKRNFFWNYVSIVTGLLMIFVALSLKYLAYLKAKREREKKRRKQNEMFAFFVFYLLAQFSIFAANTDIRR